MRAATPLGKPPYRPRRRARSLRVEILEARALLATLNVNTTADENARDGTLSLREAIEVADGTLGFNALSVPEQAQVVLSPGIGLIKFAIPGGLASYRIEPSSALPAITAPTIIDGTTQPGFAGKPIVELVGDGVPTLRYGSRVPAYGLTLAAMGITVQGLAINEFGDAQIGIGAPGGDTVRGNYLGTDVSGSLARPNPSRIDLGDGLDIVGSGHNTIGGTVSAAVNLISGNSYGIHLTGTGAPGSAVGGSSGNLIEGNLVGTDATGTKAVPNVTGIFFDGYRGGLGDGGNTIGGPNSGAGNVISGNTRDGIVFTEIGGGGTVIQQDLIGTDAAGHVPLPNGGAGLRFINGTTGVLVGTPGGGGLDYEANTIADNAGPGVVVGSSSGDPVHGITIQGNSIDGNAGLGIDLGADGVTPNAPGAGTMGANRGQNNPTITSAYSDIGSGTGSHIAGTFNSTPDTTFRIDFYKSPTVGPTGYGQGRLPATYTTVTTDAAGNATFNFAGPQIYGMYLAATATDPAGNTSEFSRAYFIDQQGQGTPLTATTTGLSTSVNPARQTDDLTFTATVAAPAGGTPTGTVAFTIDGQPMGTGTLSVVNGRAQATYTYYAMINSSGGGGGSYSQFSQFLTAGNHLVAATYEGDATFAPSTAPALIQSIAPSTTMIENATTPPRPSVGRPFALGVVVDPGLGVMPTGSVAFTFRGVTRTVPLATNPQFITGAALAVPGLAAGHYTYSVAYSGDSTHAAASATLGFDVSPNYPSPLRLVVSTAAAAVGQPVTTTATIAAPPGSHLRPTGTILIGYYPSNASAPVVFKNVPITLVRGVATASLTIPGLAGGRYNIDANYAGDPTFLPADQQNAIVNVGPGPRVTGLHRFGAGNQPTTLVVNFSEALEPGHAQLVGNYVLTGPLDASGRGTVIPIVAAVYSPAARTVTLTTARPLSDDVQTLYHLVIRGTLGGLRDLNLVGLAGAGGVAGTDYAATFRGHGLPNNSFSNP